MSQHRSNDRYHGIERTNIRASDVNYKMQSKDPLVPGEITTVPEAGNNSSTISRTRIKALATMTSMIVRTLTWHRTTMQAQLLDPSTNPRSHASAVERSRDTIPVDHASAFDEN